jgi:hypothetical protein
MSRLNVAVNQHDDRLLSVALSTATSGSGNTLIAAVANQIIRVYRLLLVPATAVTVEFLDGTTALTGVMSLLQGAQLYLPFDSKPHFTCAGAFMATLGGGVQCSGYVHYSQG